MSGDAVTLGLLHDLQRQIEELRSRDQIRELTGRYCWHVSHGEPDELAKLFCADGVFDGSQSGIGVHRGTAAIHKFYSESICPAGVAMPFIHNHVIQVQGDRAQGTCAMEGRFNREGKAITGAGYYYDSYRREDGVWRFAERRFIAFHMVPLSQGWANR